MLSEALTSEQDEAVILLPGVLVQLHLLIGDRAQGGTAGGAGGAGSPPPQLGAPLLTCWRRRREGGVAQRHYPVIGCGGVVWVDLTRVGPLCDVTLLSA